MALSNRLGGRLMLSDRLRNMRFMKERQETDFRDKLEKEQSEREKAAHWTLDADQTNNNDCMPLVVVEDSIATLDVSRCVGRHSFGNFNTNVEKRNRIVAPKPSSGSGRKSCIKKENVVEKGQKIDVLLETSGNASVLTKEDLRSSQLLRKTSASNLLFKRSSSSTSRFPLNAGKRSFKGQHSASQKRSRNNSYPPQKR